MSSLQAEANLIIAAFQLKVVDSIIKAIRTADITSAANNKGVAGTPGRGNGAGPLILNRRCHIHPEPKYENRPHIHPTATYEPRPLVHFSPRIEQQELARESVILRLPSPANQVECPIQPPWKILPRENSLPSRQTVKVHLRHTDVDHKGMLLDLFV